MVDHITRYTDRIISELSNALEDIQPVRGKQGKSVALNILPSLHHLFVKFQMENEGVKMDFTDPDRIVLAHSNYIRLIAKINEYMPFTPTRANYCAFLGTTTGRYQRILADSPPDVRDALQYTEDYFVSLTQAGAMNGDVGTNAAKMVLSTAGQYGHNLASVKEASEIMATEKRLLSAEELEANLKRITASNK